jgi:transcriptional regulator with XRE-family HTH domain
MPPGWVLRDRAHGLHPIGADEAVALEQLGRELRRLRENAQLSRRALARASLVSERFLRQLEAGAARARLASLTALAPVLADGDPDLAARLLASLVELAGDTVVPASKWSERRERNRARREARVARKAEQLMPAATRIAEAMVDDMLVGHWVVPIPPRDRSRHPPPGAEFIVRRPSRRTKR